MRERMSGKVDLLPRAGRGGLMDGFGAKIVRSINHREGV